MAAEVPGKAGALAHLQQIHQLREATVRHELGLQPRCRRGFCCAEQLQIDRMAQCDAIEEGYPTRVEDSTE